MNNGTNPDPFDSWYDREINYQGFTSPYDAAKRAWHECRSRPRPPSEDLAAANADRDAWRGAAYRVGESIGPTGPNGYYLYTAQQWADWAQQALAAANATIADLKASQERLLRECKELAERAAADLAAANAENAKLRESIGEQTAVIEALMAGSIVASDEGVIPVIRRIGALQEQLSLAHDAINDALPWMIKLGDYIGNGTQADPMGRCNAILKMRIAVEKRDD